jgi:drug/metabolite transporter (DMT)-like permease
MWSPSFLFIKLAIAELPPLTIAASRVTLAAVFLVMILYGKGLSFPRTANFWYRASIMAFFASVLPFYLFCFAEESIDSALAAIINGTTPMFTAVLAQVFVSSDRMNPQKVLGVLFSCCGVVVLFARQITEGVSGTTLGLSAATVAAFCYSLSHVYGKLYITGSKPFVAPASQLLVSSFMLVPFALYFEPPADLAMPSLSAIGGVLGLALMGTVFAFVIYYKLLEHCGPTAISTVACFFPVNGMLLGFFFLGETMPPEGMLGSLMVLIGMVLVSEVVKVKALQSKETVSIADSSPEGS